MTRVTASELQKNFGRYQAQAQREAVIVTSHGRESVVLLSAEDYERLKKLDDRVVISTADLPEDMAVELERSIEDMKGVASAGMKRHGPW